MTQPSAPDIFAADQRSHWQSGHRGIWSLQGSNLDSIPTLSILTTLWDQPRWLEAYHLYDDQGSDLFEEICELPEYYLTRTENSILAAQAKNIARGHVLCGDQRDEPEVEQPQREAVAQLVEEMLDRGEHVRARRTSNWSLPSRGPSTCGRIVAFRDFACGAVLGDDLQIHVASLALRGARITRR